MGWIYWFPRISIAHVPLIRNWNAIQPVQMFILHTFPTKWALEWQIVQWVRKLHFIIEWPVLRQVVHCTACRNRKSSNVGKFLCNVDIFILLLVQSIAQALSITSSSDWFQKLSNARVVRRGSGIMSKKMSFSSSSGICREIWTRKFWNRITNCDFFLLFLLLLLLLLMLLHFSSFSDNGLMFLGPDVKITRINIIIPLEEKFTVQHNHIGHYISEYGICSLIRHHV